jgi:hypothetical protein
MQRDSFVDRVCPVEREPLPIRQRGGADCMLRVLANEFYLYEGESELTDPRHLGEVVGYDGKEPPNQSVCGQLLLNNGYGVEVISDFEFGRFMTEGYTYWKEYHDAKGPSVWGYDLSPEEVETHRKSFEPAIEMDSAVRDHPNFNQSLRRPFIQDILDFLRLGYVVEVALEVEGRDYGHAGLIYGATRDEQGASFDLYAPAWRKKNTLRTIPAKDIEVICDMNHGIGAVKKL